MIQDLDNTKNYKAHIFTIAGVKFHQYKEALETGGLTTNSVLTVVPEPENQYDNTAVALYWEGYKLGYIPAKANDALKQRLVEGGVEGVNCFIMELNPEDTPWNMFKAIIEIPELKT